LLVDFPYWEHLHGIWHTLPNFNPYMHSAKPRQNLAAQVLEFLGGHTSAREKGCGPEGGSDDVSMSHSLTPLSHNLLPLHNPLLPHDPSLPCSPSLPHDSSPPHNPLLLHNPSPSSPNPPNLLLASPLRFTSPTAMSYLLVDDPRLPKVGAYVGSSKWFETQSVSQGHTSSQG